MNVEYTPTRILINQSLVGFFSSTQRSEAFFFYNQKLVFEVFIDTLTLCNLFISLSFRGSRPLNVYDFKMMIMVEAGGREENLFIIHHYSPR